MPREFRYDPVVPYVGNIGELMERRGRIASDRARTIANAEAQAALQRGQIWGSTIGSIGDMVAGGLQSYARDKVEASARQLETANLEKTEAETAEIRRKGDESDRLTRRETAWMGLFEKYPDGPPPDVFQRETMKIWGPKEGATMLGGIKALAELQQGEVADARDTALRLTLAYELGSPAMQAQVWPQIREAAIKGGLGTPESVPEGPPDKAYLKGIKAWALGKEPDTQLHNVPAGTSVIDERNPQGGAVFTAPGAAQNPTEASLAAAAAAGDQNAAKALNLLRQQREAGQQERAGYFTMQPIYDAQGRPIGAMKLNARTGETTFVKPDDMGGGVTARPPGTLGQMTIANEAALDSLGRLKDMYDKGAKDDIGPAEGRARSVGQTVPGGQFVTERFANFEAGTRAFQNAMIKAITGAQMSEPEAKRIMAQIPNVNDNPTVWQAKYDQSVKNLEDLEKRTRTDRGAPAADTDALLDELLQGGR